MRDGVEGEEEQGGKRDKDSGNQREGLLCIPSTLVPSYPESSKASVK